MATIGVITDPKELRRIRLNQPYLSHQETRQQFARNQEMRGALDGERYVRVSSETIARTVMVAALADIDRDGKIVGVELL